jgi:hypothetical protein
VVQTHQGVMEPLPSNLRNKWGKWSKQVFRDQGELILLLELDNLLETTTYN